MQKWQIIGWKNKMNKKEFLGILAQGYCTKENEHKELDYSLLSAIGEIAWQWIETETEKLLKQQRENNFKKILDGLTIFTAKPIGTIEGDLCDWNKPSVFASNYSPRELQDKVVKRIEDILTEINAPEPEGSSE